MDNFDIISFVFSLEIGELTWFDKNMFQVV